MLDTIVRHRRALHKIPELLYDLPETQAYLLSALADSGARIETAAGCGVLAFFDAGREETVAYRSDMDALPIRETSGVPFTSEREGRMHACGHDGHMAMLLTFADYLKAHRGELPCNVLLIFQPAEEGGAGAHAVVESGALERYGVRCIFAFHVAPELPFGQVASRPDAFMARASEMDIRVHGKSAHAACASQGADALAAAAEFVTRALEMEKRLPADALRLLKFGYLHGGATHNVIVDEMRILGTLRSFDDALFARMKASLDEIQADCEREHGVRFEFGFSAGYPPVLNDGALYLRAKAALPDLVELAEPVMIAEDFAFYQQRVPGVMFKLGLGTGIALHSPEFAFDERALLAGVETYVRLLKA